MCACDQVLKERHGLLDRHKLMLESCEANFVSQEDYIDLGRAGLGTCLLAGLPDWLIAYSARLVRTRHPPPPPAPSLLCPSLSPRRALPLCCR